MDCRTASLYSMLNRAAQRRAQFCPLSSPDILWLLCCCACVNYRETPYVLFCTRLADFKTFSPKLCIQCRSSEFPLEGSGFELSNWASL
eukprot:scaffold167313_cov31-Prasinocladus_malaysianus.AAC.1